MIMEVHIRHNSEGCTSRVTKKNKKVQRVLWGEIKCFRWEINM